MKKTLLFITMLLTLSLLSAGNISPNVSLPNANMNKSIVMEGIGSTKEEAKNNAQYAMISYIFGVSVNTTTQTNMTEENGKIVKDEFKESYASNSRGILLGVDYSYSDNKGTYTCTATLSSESLSNYKLKLNSTRNSIDQIYNQKGNSFTDTLQYYQKMIPLLEEYESYCQIVLMLGLDESEIPQLSNNITYQSMTLEYEGFLNKNREEYISNLGGDNDGAILTLLTQIHTEQEKIKNNSEARKAEQKKQENRINQMIENMKMESMLTAYSASGDNPTPYMNNLSAMLQNIAAIEEKGRTLINKERERIERISKPEIDSILKAPYRISEKSKGNPTDQAIAERNRKANEIKEYYDQQLIETENKINGFINEELNLQKAEIRKILETITDKNFSVDIKDIVDSGTLTFVEDILKKKEIGMFFDYESINSIWEFRANGTFDSTPITIEFNLPLKRFEEVKDMDNEARASFIEKITEEIRNNSFSFTFNFKLDISPDYKLTIIPERVDIVGLNLKTEVPIQNIYTDSSQEDSFIILNKNNYNEVKTDYAQANDIAQPTENTEKNQIIGLGWRGYGQIGMSMPITTAADISPECEIYLGGSVGMTIFKNYYIGAAANFKYLPSYNYWNFEMAAEIGYAFENFLYIYSKASINSVNKNFNMLFGVDYKAWKMLTIGVYAGLMDNFHSASVGVSVGVSNL